jgi:hypothetical protein
MTESPPIRELGVEGTTSLLSMYTRIGATAERMYCMMIAGDYYGLSASFGLQLEQVLFHIDHFRWSSSSTCVCVCVWILLYTQLVLFVFIVTHLQPTLPPTRFALF